VVETAYIKDRNAETQGYREQVPVTWPAPIKDLLGKCWAQNPAERPSMAWILEQLRLMRFDPKLRR